jgi:hypothetical protein
MSDYQIQLELFKEEQVARENVSPEYLTIQEAVDRYLDTHSVMDFCDLISEDSYWKLHKFFSTP